MFFLVPLSDPRTMQMSSTIESPLKDLEKTLFLGFQMAFLEIEEEVSEFETKQILMETLRSLPGWKAEWASPDRGKNLLYLNCGDTYIVLDATNLIQTIRFIWNGALQENTHPEKLEY